MRSICALGVVSCLVGTLVGNEAFAVCGAGFRVTVVQNSDIRLEPGARAYLPIRLITADLPIPAGSLPADCGVFARSEVPGLSVISAYGVTPPVTNPPGVWTPIGIASDADPGTQPWLSGTQGDRHIVFPVLADGTTPAGTQGQITVGVNEGGDVAQVIRTIGTINVVVGASDATTWFMVTSTAQNVAQHRLVLDHPLLNGNGAAKLFVAHVFNPPGLTPTYWNHPIATHFDGARWAVNNTDGTPMPAGLGFNVRIDPSATQYRTGNVAARAPVPFVRINDPVANNNPYATVLVSPTTGLAVNPHPIAVRYVAPNWQIVNADGAAIPGGVRFNVKAIGFSAYHRTAAVSNDDRIDRFVSNSAGVSVSGPNGASRDVRPLFFWWQLDRRSLPMIVTRTLSSMGQNVAPEPRYVGLKYLDGAMPQWSVIYEDQSAIPSTAAFNVAGMPRALVE